jgi:uncharacterized membrane protein
VTKMDPNARADGACAVCGKTFAYLDLVQASHVRPGLAALILAEHPGWSEKSVVCKPDLARYRRSAVEKVLAGEGGPIGPLEHQVLDSLDSGQPLSRAPVQTGPGTFGQRMADRVASFGGSWTFILAFLAVLVMWIAVNAVRLLAAPFDPFPFILLNLVLSCVAALQAPVIMMSQGRKEEKDRARAENDYQVNLKAELEIRQLQDRIDHELARQAQVLANLLQSQLAIEALIKART